MKEPWETPTILQWLHRLVRTQGRVPMRIRLEMPSARGYLPVKGTNVMAYCTSVEGAVATIRAVRAALTGTAEQAPPKKRVYR